MELLPVRGFSRAAHIRCPHRRHWHAAFHAHTEGTDYTLQMLYFTCRGLRFYAGQAGYPSRDGTQNALPHRKGRTCRAITGRRFDGLNRSLAVPPSQ